MSLLAWSVPAIPALVGTALALTRPRSRRLAVGTTLTAAAATLGTTAAAAVARPTAHTPFLLGTELAVEVDGLAAVVAVTVAGTALLVLVFAAAGGSRDVEAAPSRFGGLMLLFVAAALLTVTAATLPTLLLAWEVMGATSYALIGFAWRDPERPSAALVAFLTTRAADLGLYVAAGAALAGGQGLRLDDLARADPGTRTVIAAGVAVAALGKAAQLPFSFWLSRAMVGPSPVSALLHSAAMVAMGGYLLLRVPDLLTSTWVGTAVAWVGALTTVVLGVVAAAQTDLKQVLAASTAAQLGFVVLAAGVGGVVAGTTQLVAHAATKALLFLLAGAWLSALGTKQLSALRGAAGRWPVVGVMASLGLLSLAGVAPLSLWASKESVLASVADRSTTLHLLGLVGAALSAAYAGRVLVLIWAPVTPEDQRKRAARLDTEERGTRQVPTLERLAMAGLAVAAAALGVLALPPVVASLAATFGTAEAPAPGWPELVGSALVAAVVVVLTTRVTLPAPRWARHWLGLEAIVHRTLVAPTDRLAARLARFDDVVVDGVVEGLARSVVRTARRTALVDDTALDGAVRTASSGAASLAGLSRQLDEHGVDGAVEGIARALRRAGAALRRPQTGQLHQYYLQSVAVLAAAAVLLVLVR